MGNSLWPQQRKYIRVLQTLGMAAGVNIHMKALLKLLSNIQYCCPWFPEHGTFDLEYGNK